MHFSRLYFETGAEMPNLDQLAKDGVIFNHALSVAPVCSAARSTLATGCYPSRLAMQFHRHHKQAHLPQGVRPVYELLHDAGYSTSFRSKNDFNFLARMEKWDSPKEWSDRKPGQP